MKKPKIFNVWTHPDTKPTIAGYKYSRKFLEVIDKNTGALTIEDNGLVDLNELIQQDLESCKIENIIKQVAMGDLSMLQNKQIQYADATSLPKNLMEAQNLVLRMKQEFDTLPIDVRKEFNNSAEMYVSMMGTEEFNEKMAPYNKMVAEIKAAGSKAEYDKRVADTAQFNKDVAAKMGGNE